MIQPRNIIVETNPIMDPTMLHDVDQHVGLVYKRTLTRMTRPYYVSYNFLKVLVNSYCIVTYTNWTNPVLYDCILYA